MANRLRQLLLVISMIGLLTSGVWVFYPEAVDWADWALGGVWMHRIDVDMQEARKLRADGELEQAEVVLAELIESMDGVQIGDRRDPWMRIALRERIGILRQLDRLDDAIACARQYHDYAPRDADNILMLGTLLMQSEAHAEEGMTMLADLQKLVPEWSPIANAYAKALVAQGREREAVEVGLEFLRRAESLQSRDWVFFWDVGNSFEGNNSYRTDLEQAVEPGDYKVRVRIPPRETPLRALRIDTPLWASLRASDWLVQVRIGDQVFAFDKPGQLMKQSRINEVKERALETQWKAHCDMRFEFDQPLMLDRNSYIELEVHIDALLPPGVRQLFMDPKSSARMFKWLREAGRQDDVRLIRKAMGS
jgi:tetratricopeptide (TPR) repeat protein